MEWVILFQSILKRMLSISTWTEKWSLKKYTAWKTPSSVLSRRINSRERSMAERIARNEMQYLLVMTSSQWESRADVGTGNEQEESFEVKNPTFEEIQTPTSREEREREDCGHSVHMNWRGACVKDRGATVQLEELKEEEKERTKPSLSAFSCVDTFPIPIETTDKVKRELHGVNGQTSYHTTFHFLPIGESLEGQEWTEYESITRIDEPPHGERNEETIPKSWRLEKTQVWGSQMTFRCSIQFFIMQGNSWTIWELDCSNHTQLWNEWFKEPFLVTKIGW